MSSTSDRGQSAPLGVALLLGMTLIGTTAVVAFGSVALTDTQESSELAGAEQSMTLFDSQSAQVALGDSTSQTVDLGQNEGTYSVNPAAGKISIVQEDCDDDGVDDDAYDPDTDTLGSDDAYIYGPEDLGSVTYDTGDKVLAYQGGGVWRKGNSGGTGMVSPPEFHYRDATLTLPVVLTRGSGSASGSVKATATEVGDPIQIFPDTAGSCPSGTNPVAEGRVLVRIESEYADAWAEYFSTRTSGDVTKHGDDVVTVELISLGQIGDFGMPGEGSSVGLPGTEEHSVEEYTITLRPEDHDSANFNNLQWSMYVDEGDKEMEIYLEKSGSGGCPSTGIKADVTIYFSSDDGDTYEIWHGADAFDAKCEDRDGDGTDDDIYFEIDFIDDEDGDSDEGWGSGGSPTYAEPWMDDEESADPTLEYTDSGTSLLHFGTSGTHLTTSQSFGTHSGVDWEDSTGDYQEGGSPNEETVDRVVNHYFGMFDSEFELTVEDKPGGGGSVEETGDDSSSGRIRTSGSGEYVTFLHVTENEIEVEIET